MIDFGEGSAAPARRDDEGIAQLCRGEATQPAASRTGEIGQLFCDAPLLFCLSSFIFFSPVSCGYRAGGLLEHPRIRLDLFENDTERRLHEFDLSTAIARELAGAGVAVNAPDAPVTLRGRILDFRQPPAVERGTDEVLVGSVLIGLEVWLVRRSDGKVLWKDRRVESASFTTQRLESAETARQEVFDRLARWAVRKLEKDWE